MFIKPWSKDVERVLRRIAKDRVIYTRDIQLTRDFGRRFPELFDKENGFMDIGRIEKRHESMIALRPNGFIEPIPSPPSVSSKFIKFRFFKIY